MAPQNPGWLFHMAPQNPSWLFHMAPQNPGWLFHMAPPYMFMDKTQKSLDNHLATKAS
jgi:hypothetical protein